ncbi:MFS transporter [Chengkuizengella axinellae]|uniref:MFS transporter n=1 Tax=Chengkuizengella axinellae TaxID=3064388 RepID=A0ABT9J4I9_9BACL|nr:MFS transporter [Chengkuizengella sp. 2205SS18-9]MDP5276529.1 MFS transporter [Chengkuizengella sp. 2205SS18-9]
MKVNLIQSIRNPKSDLKNIILLGSGQFVSLFGTSIYSFAISLYILTVTGSGLSFATNLVLSILPTIILGPIAGVLTDRLNRKMIIVGADLLSGAVLLLLFFVSFVQFNLIWIFAVTLILNILNTLFYVCLEAAKPNLVHEKNLMKVNALTQMISSSSFILGPMMGGFVFAFMDIKLFILINAISFFISSASELFINFKFSNESNEGESKKTRIFKDMKEGFLYLISQKQLTGMLGIFILINILFTFSVQIPIPYIIINVLKLSELSYGIIAGAFPVGMLVGAIIVGKLSEKLMEYNKLLILMTVVSSVLIFLLGIPLLFIGNEYKLFYTIYYVALHGIFGIVIAFVDIPVITMLQKMIPDELRGRVLSVTVTIVKAFVPFAMLISGSLLNVFPAFWLTIVGGILLLLISFRYYYVQIIRRTPLNSQQA